LRNPGPRTARNGGQGLVDRQAGMAGSCTLHNYQAGGTGATTGQYERSEVRGERVHDVLEPFVVHGLEEGLTEPRLRAAQAVLRLTVARERDEHGRRFREARPQLAPERIPVHPGEAKVEDRDLWAKRLCEGQRARRIGRGPGLVTRPRQQALATTTASSIGRVV